MLKLRCLREETSKFSISKGNYTRSTPKTTQHGNKRKKNTKLALKHFFPLSSHVSAHTKHRMIHLKNTNEDRNKGERLAMLIERLIIDFLPYDREFLNLMKE